MKDVRNIIKFLKDEIRCIRQEYDVDLWDQTDISSLDSTEAFNRGVYRAYVQILEMLDSIIKKEGKENHRRLNESKR